MRFGIFYEHQLPKPWGDGQEQHSSRTPGTRLSWPPTRHATPGSGAHLLEEYSHSSAPRSSWLPRLSGPKHPPWSWQCCGSGLNPPVRVAERIATLTSVRMAESSSYRESASRQSSRVTWVNPENAARCGLETLSRSPICRDEPISRLRGQVLLDGLKRRRSRSSASPTAVGRLLQPRHHSPRGQARHRRIDLRLHRPGRSAALGQRLLRDAED